MAGLQLPPETSNATKGRGVLWICAPCLRSWRSLDYSSWMPGHRGKKRVANSVPGHMFYNKSGIILYDPLPTYFGNFSVQPSQFAGLSFWPIFCCMFKTCFKKMKKSHSEEHPSHHNPSRIFTLVPKDGFAAWGPWRSGQTLRLGLRFARKIES